LDEEGEEEDQFLAEYDIASGTLMGRETTVDEDYLKELYSRDNSGPEYAFIF